MAITTVAATMPLAPQDNNTPCPFHTLPSEILLEIISGVPFTPSNFLSLRLTCRRFHEVLTQHEAPIATSTSRRTFGKTADLFPVLQTPNFRNLGRLHSRVQTLDNVHEEWLRITNNSPELEWLKGRFEGVHKAGLLLLYHLQDLRLRTTTTPSQDNANTTAAPTPICDHCQRTLFLRSLPATSLACILFKLISSVKLLRIYGPEPIHEGWKKGDAASRSDVELVCEELILKNGPWFFLALLKPDVDARETGRALGRLQSEQESLPYRQSPFYPPTLISILRRALAEKTGVDVRFVVSKMWEILASTGFDDLEADGGLRMGKVVRGEELSGEERGMRRIF